MLPIAGLLIGSLIVFANFPETFSLLGFFLLLMVAVIVFVKIRTMNKRAKILEEGQRPQARR